MKEITKDTLNELIKTLKLRFEENMNRHPNMIWEDVLERLNSDPSKLWSLYEMEFLS